MSSKIEWLRGEDGRPGYTINPVKGLCPVACDYCYARRMYKRFKWDETVRWEPKPAFATCFNAPPGSKIFVGSTMELFGEWVHPERMNHILVWVKMFPNKTFIFLTKRPENLHKFNPWPRNCWVGVSVSNQDMLSDGLRGLLGIDAKVRYLSCEPLLAPLNVSFNKDEIQWLIIGQQTPISAKTAPKLSWLQEIVEAADRAEVPIFLKDNLRELLCRGSTPWAWQPNAGILRQEYPNVQ